MTSTEIRVHGIGSPSNSWGGDATPGTDRGVAENLGVLCGCMLEIAAQLAELNERIGRITAGTEHVFTETCK
jgi:hypothetical protein